MMVGAPTNGDRNRYDETISTAFMESTVNYVVSRRFVKKQQMRWTQRGAYLLLQTRVQVLNDDLRNTFCRVITDLTGFLMPPVKAAVAAESFHAQWMPGLGAWQNAEQQKLHASVSP
jgi:hypothetical protein